MKTFPQKDVRERVNEIWYEYLGPDASCPINVDSKSYEITKRNLQKADRWCYDIAAVQITSNKFTLKLNRFAAKIFKLNSNKRNILLKYLEREKGKQFQCNKCNRNLNDSNVEKMY